MDCMASVFILTSREEGTKVTKREETGDIQGKGIGMTPMLQIVTVNKKAMKNVFFTLTFRNKS